VLESLKGRVRILHLKDMKRTADGPTFAEIGQGNLNWQGILDVANAIGVRHCIVEQDQCDGDPLDSIRMSYEYLKNLNT
jgi:sugar phosphate isomerase/epimerase